MSMSASQACSSLRMNEKSAKSRTQSSRVSPLDDIIGLKFGSLIVVAAAPSIAKSSRRWFCQCACGEIVERNAQYLLRGKCTDCGCVQKQEKLQKKIAEEFGKRYGSLVIDAFDHSKGRYTHWACICDCGNKVVKRCDRLKKTRESATCEKGACRKFSMAPDVKMLRQIIRGYKKSARKRKLPFSLSDEHFEALLNGDCHYCGCKPNLERPESLSGPKCNGIDRVDNKKGYVEGNVVTACSECNRAKSSLLLSVFLRTIRNVVE